MLPSACLAFSYCNLDAGKGKPAEFCSKGLFWRTFSNEAKTREKRTDMEGMFTLATIASWRVAREGSENVVCGGFPPNDYFGYTRCSSFLPLPRRPGTCPNAALRKGSPPAEKTGRTDPSGFWIFFRCSIECSTKVSIRTQVWAGRFSDVRVCSLLWRMP